MLNLWYMAKHQLGPYSCYWLNVTQSSENAFLLAVVLLDEDLGRDRFLLTTTVQPVLNSRGAHNINRRNSLAGAG